MKRLALVLALLCLALLACGGGGSNGSEPTSVPAERAWYACTTLIERQLGYSIMDAERYSRSKVTALGGDQFLANIIYADQGQEFDCLVQRRSNGDWELVDLSPH